jgi:hypothetical protein
MTVCLRDKVLGALLAAAAGLAGCSGQVGTSLEQQCAEGLDIAYKELEQAKVDGFGDTVTWSKAASLLTAASVQKQFEKYPNCIDKVRRARAYLSSLRR